MNVTEFRRRGDAIADHVSKWHHHPEAMCHMLRFRKMEDFNELDLEDIKKQFAALAEDLSPCGNLRKAGGLSDDTVHGQRDKVHV